MSDIIYVENELNGMEVLINDIVQDVTPEGFIYVRDGEDELKSYVTNIMKPEIKTYVEEQKSSAVADISLKTTAAKQEIASAVATVHKPDIEAFASDKKAEIEVLCGEKEDTLSGVAQEQITTMEGLVSAAAASAQSAENSSTQAGEVLSQVEAKVDEAENWAIGAYEVRPEGSAKYWAEKTQDMLGAKIDTDFSNAEYVPAKTDLSNVTPAQSFKDMVVGWGMPDYSAGITPTLPYTAPSDGMYVASPQLRTDSGATSRIYVNGKQVFYLYNPVNSFISLPYTLLLKKGDVVSASSSYGASEQDRFYPMKGVV